MDAMISETVFGGLGPETWATPSRSTEPEDAEPEEEIQEEEELDFLSSTGLGVEQHHDRDGTRSGTRRTRSLRSCMQSNGCTVCIYLVVVLLIMVSLVSLVVVGAVVVAPYLKVRTFVPVACSPEHAVKDYNDNICSCGKWCHTRMPCVRLIVRLYPPGWDSATSWSAVLLEDESKLGRKCSFYTKCDRSPDRNQLAIGQFVRAYGRVNRNFTCFYNPDDVSEVIRTRIFTIHHVIHGLLWPTIVLFLSSLSLDFTFRHRRLANS